MIHPIMTIQTAFPKIPDVLGHKINRLVSVTHHTSLHNDLETLVNNMASSAFDEIVTIINQVLIQGEI
jgi:hypothetical protein